jgi:hypothetical protein
MEVELFEQRRWDNGNVGVALIRDGNGTRSFATLMRYRSAAMAEFMRALRTLKALQAEQAAAEVPAAALAPAREKHSRPAPRPQAAQILGPNEPERRPVARAERRPGSPPEPALKYDLPSSLAPGRTLHEPAAPWLPNEPEAGQREQPTAGGTSPRRPCQGDTDSQGRMDPLNRCGPYG